MRTATRASERIIPLLLTAFFLILAPAFIGLSFGDDSFYLWVGQGIKPSDLIGSQDWSPLYCLWFRLITLVVSSPITQYFTSWAILVALAALLPTIMRIRFAWLYGALLVSIPFLTAFPYVGLFAGVILLFGTCLTLQRERSLSTVLTMVCLFSFVLSFCRPEFTVCVYLGAAATLIALALERSGHYLLKAAARPTPTTASALVLATSVVSLAVVSFLIFAHNPSKRSGLAFAQHYNRRAADRGLIQKSVDVWASNYAEQAFGIDTAHTAANGTASLQDFLRAGPRLFFEHLLANLVDPKTLLFLLLVCTVVAWPWLRSNRAHLRGASLWIACISLPPFAGMLVIYPRNHYAMILFPSLLLFAMQLIQPERWIQPSALWAIAVGGFLIVFLNLGLPWLQHTPVTFERVSLLRAECIRRAELAADPANPQVFDSSLTTGVYYLPQRTATRPSDLAQWPQFAAWVANSHPAWISMESNSAEPYHKTPAEVSGFLTGTQGYTAHPCPGSADLTLYIPTRP